MRKLVGSALVAVLFCNLVAGSKADLGVVTLLRKTVLLFRRPSLHKKVLFLPGPPTQSPMEASSISSASVLLIVFPGAKKAPETYTGLCDEVQKLAAAEGLNVDVGIARFFLDAATILGVMEFEDLVKAIKKKSGKKYSHTILMGHSLATGPELMEVALPFNGVIRMGASMTAMDSFWSYPKPVLNLLGRNDGFIPYITAAHAMEDLMEQPNGQALSPAGMFHTKPVIVVEDVNHMGMADGEMTKLAYKLNMRDMDSPISLEESWTRVATVITDFLVSIIDPHSKQTQNLVQSTIKTQQTLEAYRRLSSPSNIAAWASWIQQRLANVEGMLEGVTEFRDNLQHFLYSKPSVDGRGRVKVQVYAQGPVVFGPFRLMKTATTYAIKFKSQEAILAANGELQPLGTQVALQTMNEETFQNVLENFITTSERKRYEDEGMQLRFDPDIEVETTISASKWVNSDLNITILDDEAHLSSTFFTTNMTEPAKFAGMFYGKVMSPAQAYEWIVFDSLKARKVYSE